MITPTNATDTSGAHAATDKQERNLPIRALAAFRRADRTLKALENDVLSGHGLTATQFSVLQSLALHGEMRVCQLVRSMLSTSGNMTVVLRNMERDGLIVRRANPDDARSYFIGLTDEGHALINTVLPEFTSRLGSAIASALDEADQRELIRLAGQLQNAAES